MPSRKNIRAPPQFSFVTLGFEAKAVSWLKIHSGAVRSHAAYWGGPVKYQRRDQRQVAEQQQNAKTNASDNDKESTSPGNAGPGSVFFASPPVSRHGSARSKTARSAVKAVSLRHIEPDVLQHLPLLPSEIKAMASPIAADLSTFQFFGAGFVKQFLMSDHEDYSIMLSGCQLLSYAHSMALTGQGTKTVLLELKSHVIHHVSAKMKSSDGWLSPQSLIAILALGAPIVCLVSQDLPKRLSVWEYLNASMRDDYLCCPDSAETANRALHEWVVHQRATCRLLAYSAGRLHDADGLALLQYVSNCMNIWMAIEAATHLATPLTDGGDPFQASDRCEKCNVPAQWTWPLTCRWLDKTTTTPVETQMLQLAGLTHRWLGTFLDRDSRGLILSGKLLKERASLRQTIEHFAPVAKGSNPEAEAMYESCRWASLMLLTVDKLRIPIHAAAKHVRIQPRLIRRLRMTNLSELWGVHKGLLFWVTTTCYLATAGQCFPLLATTLLARFTQEIAMSDFCSEIAIKPLKRLRQFERLCYRPESTNEEIMARR